MHMEHSEREKIAPTNPAAHIASPGHRFSSMVSDYSRQASGVGSAPGSAGGAPAGGISSFHQVVLARKGRREGKSGVAGQGFSLVRPLAGS